MASWDFGLKICSRSSCSNSINKSEETKLYSTPGALYITICSWSKFDLENLFKLFMLQEQALGAHVPGTAAPGDISGPKLHTGAFKCKGSNYVSPQIV